MRDRLIRAEQQEPIHRDSGVPAEQQRGLSGWWPVLGALALVVPLAACNSDSGPQERLELPAAASSDDSVRRSTAVCDPLLYGGKGETEHVSCERPVLPGDSVWVTFKNAVICQVVDVSPSSAQDVVVDCRTTPVPPMPSATAS